MIDRKCEVVCDVCGEKIEDEIFFRVFDKSYAWSPSGAINLTGRGETIGEKDLCAECHKSYMEFIQPEEQEDDTETPPEDQGEETETPPEEDSGENTEEGNSGEGQTDETGSSQEEGETAQGEGGEPISSE